MVNVGDIIEFADDSGKWCVWKVDNVTRELSGVLKVDYVELNNDEMFVPRRCTKYYGTKIHWNSNYEKLANIKNVDLTEDGIIIGLDLCTVEIDRSEFKKEK